jgi:predicted nucleotidyltransferase
MELSGSQKESLRELTEKSGLRLILLFGSEADGVVHARSDLDIAVGTRAGKGFSGDLYDQLLERLGRIFPGRKVDLASLDHADPLFLKEITDHCRLLGGKSVDLQRLKILAFRRFQDYKRYLTLERGFAERFVGERVAGR